MMLPVDLVLSKAEGDVTSPHSACWTSLAKLDMVSALLESEVWVIFVDENRRGGNRSVDKDLNWKAASNDFQAIYSLAISFADPHSGIATHVCAQIISRARMCSSYSGLVSPGNEPKSFPRLYFKCCRSTFPLAWTIDPDGWRKTRNSHESTCQ